MGKLQACQPVKATIEFATCADWKNSLHPLCVCDCVCVFAWAYIDGIDRFGVKMNQNGIDSLQVVYGSAPPKSEMPAQPRGAAERLPPARKMLPPRTPRLKCSGSVRQTFLHLLSLASSKTSIACTSKGWNQKT